MLRIASIFLVLTCTLFACVTPQTPEAKEDTGKVIRFTGKVQRGEDFVKPLRDDLAFRLIYIKDNVNEEWMFWVGDLSEPDDNYCSVVMPPYRGRNFAITLAGWHYRQDDNSPLIGNFVNTPVYQKKF